MSASGFTEFFQKPSQLSKMPRLNNERNQAIGRLNAGMSATVVSRHFGCTRKTIKRLRRRLRVTGYIALEVVGHVSPLLYKYNSFLKMIKFFSSMRTTVFFCSVLALSKHVFVKEKLSLTLFQTTNFRPFQTQRLCRRQF